VGRGLGGQAPGVGIGELGPVRDLDEVDHGACVWGGCRPDRPAKAGL
jgi:hypothetical protein